MPDNNAAGFSAVLLQETTGVPAVQLIVGHSICYYTIFDNNIKFGFTLYYHYCRFSYQSRQARDKHIFLNHFTRLAWYELSDVERESHSFYNCKACLQPSHHDIYTLLRRNSHAKSEENIIPADLHTDIVKLTESSDPTSAQEAVNNVITSVNQYNNIKHGLEQMERARSKSKPEQELVTKVIKEVGREITDRYNSSILKNNQSYRSMANIRRDITLTITENAKPSVIKHERFGFDRVAVKAHITEMSEAGIKPVWVDVARRFPVRRPDGELAKNANEVLKRYAISEGLYQPATATPRSRRGKRKIEIEGIEIDLSAIFPTDQALKSLTREKISAGIIDIGQPIVPVTLSYKRILKGKIETVVVTMYGRAYPLQTIMDKTLRDHSKEGFLRRPFPDDYNISTALSELAAKGKPQHIEINLQVKHAQ